jgi:hypothetical protein
MEEEKLEGLLLRREVSRSTVQGNLLRRGRFVCPICGGRGWVVQAMIEEARAKDIWPGRTS